VSNKEKALGLAKVGIYVFPVKVAKKEDNPYRTTKKPLAEHGVLDATTDSTLIAQWWKKFPDAHVGVAMGPSGFIALDFDIKKSTDGTVEVDGFENFGPHFLDLPDTFSFDSVSGAGGKQYIFMAPEGRNLGPSQNYRGIEGLDTRAGNSYSVWNGPVPVNGDEFTVAPEWACDEKIIRSLNKFEGEVKDWEDSLVSGEPSLAVRKAVERTEELFTIQGNDLTHSDIVERQHEAVRLGAEGHPGVATLLNKIQELTERREGEHSRNPDEYEHEYLEALTSGIKKHGGATKIRLEMPNYSLDLVPESVPERLVTGDPADKAGFSALMAACVNGGAEELETLSVLWNCPTTRELAREWGLEFCLKRIRAATITPEPVGENPILEARRMDTTPVGLLTYEEKALVKDYPNFIDQYLVASAKKGYSKYNYDICSAWTLLSAAFGLRAVIPQGKPYGVNLWFLAIGDSGSGKSASNYLLRESLDLLLNDGEGYYNLGADSSPEGLHRGLLERDMKVSMLHKDEAATFFENLKKKDWMSGLEGLLSDWYEGRVNPSHKINLKELKGKSAKTSFNVHALSTPRHVLEFLDLGMFKSGFLARFNFAWEPPVPSDDRKYQVNRTEVDDGGINPEAYKLVQDLLFARRSLKPGMTNMNWTPEAEHRLIEAHKKMDREAMARDKYDATEFSVTRLKETAWKCAALLALWRGEDVIRDIDAMTALLYVEQWFSVLFRVVDVAGEGEFNKDANEIEAFIGSKKGVSQAVIYTRFKSIIQRSPRELDDRIEFLVTSGRIVKNDSEKKGVFRYYQNGSMSEGGSDEEVL